MKITLPWPHKDLNPNARVHWAKKNKHVKYCRELANYAARANGIKNDTDLALSVVFNPPDRRRRDLDNMLASCKAYLDGIADALGVDDSNFKLTIQKGEPVKGGAVIVEVL